MDAAVFGVRGLFLWRMARSETQNPYRRFRKGGEPRSGAGYGPPLNVAVKLADGTTYVTKCANHLIFKGFAAVH